MHVLVAVDKIGAAAERRLEGIELPLDLGRYLPSRQAGRQSARDDLAVRREHAFGRKARHRPERRSRGQVQVQPDADPAVERLEPGRGAREGRAIRHRAHRRDAAALGKLEDAAAHPLRQPEIVGAENDAGLAGQSGPLRHAACRRGTLS